jgi:hypothetical protein
LIWINARLCRTYQEKITERIEASLSALRLIPDTRRSALPIAAAIIPPFERALANARCRDAEQDRD